jgi:hypothetical protein
MRIKWEMCNSNGYITCYVSTSNMLMWSKTIIKFTSLVSNFEKQKLVCKKLWQRLKKGTKVYYVRK